MVPRTVSRFTCVACILIDDAISVGVLCVGELPDEDICSIVRIGDYSRIVSPRNTDSVIADKAILAAYFPVVVFHIVMAEDASK